MAASNTPNRLCGASFFVLLQKARKLRSKARDTDVNGADRSSSEYMPFDDETRVAAFDTAVTSSYSKPLEEMAGLVDSVIDPGKDAWLANTSLALLESDTTIPDTALFYATSNGSPLAKRQLCETPDVCLEALLLGLWHYIVTEVRDNKVGKETMDRWLTRPAVKGAPLQVDEEALPMRTRSQARVYRLHEGVGEMNEEPIEAEVIDETPSQAHSETPPAGPQDTPEGRQPSVVVMMGGTGNQQIGHVDTLNLNGWRWPQ